MIFSLSNEGLHRINLSNYENDFEILFSNNKNIKCPSFLAEYLSPEISKVRCNDSSILKFTLNYDIKDETIEKCMIYYQVNQLILKKMMN